MGSEMCIRDRSLINGLRVEIIIVSAGPYKPIVSPFCRLVKILNSNFVKRLFIPKVISPIFLLAFQEISYAYSVKKVLEIGIQAFKG